MRQTKDKLDLQLESNATSANGAKHISKFIGKRKRLRPKAKKANASKGNKNSKQEKNYKIEKTANLSLLTGNLVFPWDEIEQDDSENPSAIELEPHRKFEMTEDIKTYLNSLK